MKFHQKLASFRVILNYRGGAFGRAHIFVWWIMCLFVQLWWPIWCSVCCLFFLVIEHCIMQCRHSELFLMLSQQKICIGSRRTRRTMMNVKSQRLRFVTLCAYFIPERIFPFVRVQWRDCLFSQTHKKLSVMTLECFILSVLMPEMSDISILNIDYSVFQVTEVGQTV